MAKKKKHHLYWTEEIIPVVLEFGHVENVTDDESSYHCHSWQHHTEDFLFVFQKVFLALSLLLLTLFFHFAFQLSHFGIKSLTDLFENQGLTCDERRRPILQAIRKRIILLRMP